MSRRFYGTVEAGVARIRGDDAHHAAVLRVAPGDRVVVLDGGSAHEVEVLRVAPDLVEGRVLARLEGRELPVHLALLQGLPKAAKMDLIVRMGTELGVAEFVPVRTARAVKQGGRVDRWQRIAREAAKQSGRAVVPQVREITTLGDALRLVRGYDALLVPWEGERERTIAGALGDLPARVAIVIGPEGGLSEDEVGEIAEAGGVPVTLGPLVLRTETAGLVAATIVIQAAVLPRRRA